MPSGAASAALLSAAAAEGPSAVRPAPGSCTDASSRPCPAAAAGCPLLSSPLTLLTAALALRSLEAIERLCPVAFAESAAAVAVSALPPPGAERTALLALQLSAASALAISVRAAAVALTGCLALRAGSSAAASGCAALTWTLYEALIAALLPAGSCMLVGAGGDAESSARCARPAPGGSAPERMRVLMPCAQACWARLSAALQCRSQLLTPGITVEC